MTLRRPSLMVQKKDHIVRVIFKIMLDLIMNKIFNVSRDVESFTIFEVKISLFSVLLHYMKKKNKDCRFRGFKIELKGHVI